MGSRWTKGNPFRILKRRRSQDTPISKILLLCFDSSPMIQDVSHAHVLLDGIIDSEDVFNEVIKLDSCREGHL